MCVIKVILGGPAGPQGSSGSCWVTPPAPTPGIYRKVHMQPTGRCSFVSLLTGENEAFPLKSLEVVLLLVSRGSVTCYGTKNICPSPSHFAHCCRISSSCYKLMQANPRASRAVQIPGQCRKKNLNDISLPLAELLGVSEWEAHSDC